MLQVTKLGSSTPGRWDSASEYLSSEMTSALLTDLDPGQEYLVRIVAFSKLSFSVPSLPLSYVTPGAPVTGESGVCVTVCVCVPVCFVGVCVCLCVCACVCVFVCVSVLMIYMMIYIHT